MGITERLVTLCGYLQARLLITCSKHCVTHSCAVTIVYVRGITHRSFQLPTAAISGVVATYVPLFEKKLITKHALGWIWFDFYIIVSRKFVVAVSSWPMEVSLLISQCILEIAFCKITLSSARTCAVSGDRLPLAGTSGASHNWNPSLKLP